MTQNGGQELESKVRFALEHPAARTDERTLARVLGAPDRMRQVLDYWDGGERVLLAILREGSGGPATASQLLILGCRMPLDAGAFSGFIDEVEGRITLGSEGDRALEVVLSAPLGGMRELLKRRGYSDAYAYLTLVADVPLTVDSDDADWRDVDASNVDAAYACHRDAFLETGAPIASPEEGRAVLLGADPRPRVWVAEGKVAAVLRVGWRDEAMRRGELRFICRDPRFRGQRVGDRAMAETFRVLRRMDASSVQLDVASTNRVALDLYDRWGFRRAEQEDVLRIALPGRAQAVVRRADKGDLAAILDIYAEDELSTSPEPTDLAAIADAFDAITNDPKAFLYVATLEDRVVGTFQMNVLRHLTHGGGHVAQIESVAVSRSCRGQGIGTEMMRFALAEARRLGCIRAQLTSQKRRARAHTFYEALGFERTHEGMKLKL